MNKRLHILTFILSLLLASASVHAQQIQFVDLDYPYNVNYQEVGSGQQIAYIDEGEGMPLILIHGLGSYIPAWKQNIPALSKQYRVIALDLPGYGKSSKNVAELFHFFFCPNRGTAAGFSRHFKSCMDGTLNGRTDSYARSFKLSE